MRVSGSFILLVQDRGWTSRSESQPHGESQEGLHGVLGISKRSGSQFGEGELTNRQIGCVWLAERVICISYWPATAHGSAETGLQLSIEVRFKGEEQGCGWELLRVPSPSLPCIGQQALVKQRGVSMGADGRQGTNSTEEAWISGCGRRHRP